MNELTAETRFSGLAEGYDRHRPSYPDALWQQVASSVGEAAPHVALDIGAGTGISTRQLASALSTDWQVIGIEPNADMRTQAVTKESSSSRISYIDRQAEALGMKQASAGLVTVAQAIHWFDRPVFYAGIGTVLATGGVLAIVYNDRDVDGDGLLGQFENLMEREMPGYDRNYRRGRNVSGQDDELAALEWVDNVASHLMHREELLTPQTFAGLMLSRSKLKPFTDKHGDAEAERILIQQAANHTNDAGMISMGYTSRIHIATRNGAT
ncbi:MAG: class I SAM-dependent methyltransferase [Rhodospirillaceae bacterium]|nr:class I SAM-dependent methyltransferase [Rhodospirillaceae bacterium]